MKRKLALLVALLMMTASCDQSHLQQAQVPVTPSVSESDRALLTWAEGSEKQGEKSPASAPAVQMDLPRAAELDGRKKLVPAIYATFARRTTPARAKWLAEICYEKTEGTKFTPLDLAEIALAETGGHKLSSRAVSPKGALGVWQLMPERAESHGYTPQDMWDDEKCAEAAVKELHEKLDMAKGNMGRAKRLYCGTGPAARAYDKIRKRFRTEILREMQRGMLMQQVAVNR
ncbi:transglycosylase SLT domain-containing protein [Geomonas agri]|uniref:transglycosylase SLT domain-containing protein n=1 Tax=Geomonas agri TaxID=2873702 RepID=UPI001CD34BCA|nr:transglycosylase SLT domain-containing protein [Geomonas agri]